VGLRGGGLKKGRKAKLFTPKGGSQGRRHIPRTFVQTTHLGDEGKRGKKRLGKKIGVHYKSFTHRRRPATTQKKTKVYKE